MKRCRTVQNAGFTLVELLVTVSLVALVGATVVASVTGCLKVWERINEHGRQAQWVAVAFDQLRQDLRSPRRFGPIPFDGTHDAVSFASVVPMTTAAGVDMNEMGRIGYYFDAHRQMLCRSQQSYRFLRRVQLKDACDPVLTNVERVRFSYYVTKPETKTGEWFNEWSSPQPPLAVKVEVRYHERTTNHADTQTLLVYVPSATGSIR